MEPLIFCFWNLGEDGRGHRQTIRHLGEWIGFHNCRETGKGASYRESA